MPSQSVQRRSSPRKAKAAAGAPAPPGGAGNNGPAPAVGRRTGVTVPPRGQVRLGPDGLEDPDDFFASARSPAPGSASASAGGSRREQGASPGRKRRDGGEKKKRAAAAARDELEAEAGANASRRPDALGGAASLLLTAAGDGDGEDGAGGPDMYAPTPRAPGWTDRAMHAAMGVGEDAGDYSPQDTVLSKVTTAARPTSRASLESVDTAARHAARDRTADDQLVRIGGNGAKDDSPSEPVDPPEEETGFGGGGRRGMDPDEEREEEAAADPEGSQESGSGTAESEGGGRKPSPEELDESLEELVDRDASNKYYNDDYDDDDGGGGAMQFATQEDDGAVDFGDGGDGFDDEGEDDVSARASQKSRASSKSSRSDDVDLDDDGMIGARSESEEEPEPPKKKVKETMSKMSKSDSSSATTPTSVLRNTKKGKGKKGNKDAKRNRVNFSTPNGVSQGIPAGNREYEAVPVSDYRGSGSEDATTPGGSSLRRSRRARFKPLDFWKNEKLIYEPQRETGLLGEAMGDMPVVAGVMHALPTPYRERKAPPKKDDGEDTKKKSKKGKKRSGDDSDDDDAPSREPFDDKALRKKYKIKSGESGHVWSETLENTLPTKIVSRIDGRTFSMLPLSSDRKKRESKVVGFASQAFHVQTDDDDLFPGYIAGNVVLPPRGIKDAEGVGLCSQVFNVGDCQPNSVEFALADPNGQDGEFDPKTAQRYLLSKGDMFQIPPGNVYRIENHSKHDRATLFWTIVKCTRRAEQEGESDEDDGESGATSS